MRVPIGKLTVVTGPRDQHLYLKNKWTIDDAPSVQYVNTVTASRPTCCVPHSPCAACESLCLAASYRSPSSVEYSQTIDVEQPAASRAAVNPFVSIDNGSEGTWDPRQLAAATNWFRS